MQHTSHIISQTIQRFAAALSTVRKTAARAVAGRNLMGGNRAGCVVTALALCALAGCSSRQDPTPTVPPAPTVAATATRAAPPQLPSPTPTVQVTPTPTVDDYAATRPFTLTLTTGWTIESTGDAARNRAPTAPATGAPLGQAHLAPLVAQRRNGDGETLAQLLVVELPRNDLTLETYLAGAAQALATHDLTITNRQLRDDLRPDHTPVAVLEYDANTEPPAATDTLPHGKQAALFTPDGAAILLISYATTPGADPDEFDRIVETLVVGEPPLPHQ